MKILRHILVGAIVLSGSVLNLTGCGQTGPLYLPNKPGALLQFIDTPSPLVASVQAFPHPSLPQASSHS